LNKLLITVKRCSSDGLCFDVQTVEATHAEAVTICKDLGGFLAKTNSYAENKHLQLALKDYGKSYVWMVLLVSGAITYSGPLKGFGPVSE